MEILIVRHGESNANLDQSHYLDVADHRVELSQRGVDQAHRAGVEIRSWVAERWPADAHVRMWNSPYTRTRQTADAIAAELGTIVSDRREHVLLAEQQFGLFDGLSDDEAAARYPDEWAHFERCVRFDGKFWARNPMGESRFDVAVRVHQAFGTFHRDAARHDISHLIVVAHGTTLRAFTMMWAHHPYEWFEAEPNPANCAVRHLSDGGVDHGYIWAGEAR